MPPIPPLEAGGRHLSSGIGSGDRAEDSARVGEWEDARPSGQGCPQAEAAGAGSGPRGCRVGGSVAPDIEEGGKVGGAN